MALVGAAAIGSTDPLTKQANELGVTSGTIDRAAEVQAHSKRARTLAGEGKLVDAEAAFEEAIAVANREGARSMARVRWADLLTLCWWACTLGLRLLELLTLRDLKKHVLDGLGTRAPRSLTLLSLAAAHFCQPLNSPHFHVSCDQAAVARRTNDLRWSMIRSSRLTASRSVLRLLSWTH